MDATEKQGGNQSESSLAKIAGISFALLIGLAAAFNYGQRAEIMANWPKRRCQPGVVVSAGLYKPSDDTRSVSDFAKDNFQFCQGSLAQDALQFAATPVRFLQDKQQVIMGVIGSSVNLVTSAYNKLVEVFDSVLSSVQRRFLATFIELKSKFNLLFDVMGKIMAALTSVAMILIAILVSFTTMIQFALYVIAIIVGILIALMVIFAAFISPVSWLVFAGIAVVGIIAGAVTGAMVTSSFCITGDTSVIMSDGSSKTISSLKVGDLLGHGSGRVTACLRLRSKIPTSIYNIDGVKMTGAHMLQNDSGEAIYAKKHPRAFLQGVETNFYNLNTTSRRIPVQTNNNGFLMLLDYEEIPENDLVGLAEWKKTVYEIINGVVSSSPLADNTTEAGIRGDVKVFVSDCGLLPISQVEVGDEISTLHGFTKVVGVVEVLIDAGTPIYDGLTNGVWFFEPIKAIWIPLSSSGKKTILLQETKMYHLFTDKGTFLVNDTLVRDFSEVGLHNLHKTYDD
jgi:hypothetical protein